MNNRTSSKKQKNEFYSRGYDEMLTHMDSLREFKRYSNYFEKNYGDKLPRSKNSSILDLGCGKGIFLRYLKNKGYKNIYGVDLSPENVAICKDNDLNVTLGDMLEFMEDADTKFDLVVMNDLFEHIEKREIISVLSKIKRVLKKESSLLIKTMNMSNPIAMNTLFCDFTHEWGYTEKSISQVCKVAGYSNVKVYPCVVLADQVIVDFLIPFVYKILALKYKLIYLFYGKQGYKIFTKNLLCVAKLK